MKPRHIREPVRHAGLPTWHQNSKPIDYCYTSDLSIRGPECERVRSNIMGIPRNWFHVMPLFPLLLFIMIPMLEIAVIIWVGSVIGLWSTLLAIISTAALGLILVHHQGLEVLKQAQSNFLQGRLPVNEITDGIYLLVAGALLLLPGFISDLLGGLFLIPLFRNLIQAVVLAQFFDKNRVRIDSGALRRHTPDDRNSSEIVEGNFTVSPKKDGLFNDPNLDNGDTIQEESVPSRWGRK